MMATEKIRTQHADTRARTSADCLPSLPSASLPSRGCGRPIRFRPRNRSPPYAMSLSDSAAHAASGSNGKNTMQDYLQEYYGKILTKSDDLETNAASSCGARANMPDNVRAVMPLLHDEVIIKYYGCGVAFPEQLEGCTILDLGCGAGRDSYIVSKLVGPEGKVVGVDMTPEQIEVANRHVEFHTKSFGYDRPNIEFKTGYIEKLADLGLPDNHFDVIVSNCVVNLSPDKDAVLREAYRVLKPGGEMYFSDMYADRRVPPELASDPVLFREGLGALYWNDFLELARARGFRDPRLVKDSRITISNKKIRARVGDIAFFSATYRLFKLPELERDYEDYGEAVIYRGTLASCSEAFTLDRHHTMDAGRVCPVSRNTLHMLTGTRFARHFDKVGDGATHRGLFPDRGKQIPFASAAGKDAAAAKAGCC